MHTIQLYIWILWEQCIQCPYHQLDNLKVLISLLGMAIKKNAVKK